VTILATTVALVGASVLLWAGLEKAREPGSAASMLRALGVPARLATAGVLVIPAELAVAVGLVFRPDSIWTQGGVVVLAGAFAVAGLLALRRDESIRCACFGSARGGYLGAKQVVALAPWLVGIGILNVADVPPPSATRAAALLAGVALIMAGVRLISVLGASHEARGDRRSAQETYVWLQR
jgi:hypothetical protein